MIAAPAKQTARQPGQPWSIDDASRHLGISDRHLRRLCDLGRVKTIAYGRRRMIPDAELQRIANEGTGN